jgi:hypothetical protein
MKARVVAWCLVVAFCGALLHWGPRLSYNPFSGIGANAVARSLPTLPPGCRSVKECS